MPLENAVIMRLNEITAMAGSKAVLSEQDVLYIRKVFGEILGSGASYDVDEIESWLQNEGHWNDAGPRSRVVNAAHYVQSRHEQSSSLPMAKGCSDDSCSCGS